MRKINKDYNLKIICIAICITLFFTNPLYSFSSSKMTLRLPMDTEQLSKRMLETNDFLVSEDIEDDNRAKIINTFFTQLGDEIHDVKVEKISVIPYGSKKIERDGRVLWITPKAITEMEQLDNFARSTNIDAEITGFGLTKPYNDKTTVVIDFLAPRADKIFVLELPIEFGMPYGEDLSHLTKIGIELMELLADSDQLRLSCVNNEVCLKSNSRDLPVSLERMITALDKERKRAQAWSLIYNFLDRLSNQRLPHNIDELKDVLEGLKNISLNTDWDTVVSASYALETVGYVTRLLAEAKQQKAIPDYSMHYHPNYEGIVTGDMKKAVRSSCGDFEYAKKRRVRWYEIRTLGTDEEPESRMHITSQIYNTDEVYHVESFIRDILEKIEALDPNVKPSEVYGYVEKLLSHFEKLSSLNYNTANVVKFILGREKYNKYSGHLEDARNIKSIKDMVLRAVFYKVDPLSQLQKISLDILNMHTALNTHSIYQRIMSAVVADPNGEEKLNDLGWENKPLLYNLSTATDKERIEKALQIAIDFSDTLTDASTSSENDGVKLLSDKQMVRIDETFEQRRGINLRNLYKIKEERSLDGILNLFQKDTIDIGEMRRVNLVRDEMLKQLEQESVDSLGFEVSIWRIRDTDDWIVVKGEDNGAPREVEINEEKIPHYLFDAYIHNHPYETHAIPSTGDLWVFHNIYNDDRLQYLIRAKDGLTAVDVQGLAELLSYEEVKQLLFFTMDSCVRDRIKKEHNIEMESLSPSDPIVRPYLEEELSKLEKEGRISTKFIPWGEVTGDVIRPTEFILSEQLQLSSSSARMRAHKILSDLYEELDVTFLMSIFKAVSQDPIEEIQRDVLDRYITFHFGYGNERDKAISTFLNSSHPIIRALASVKLSTAEEFNESVDEKFENFLNESEILDSLPGTTRFRIHTMIGFHLEQGLILAMQMTPKQRREIGNGFLEVYLRRLTEAGISRSGADDPLVEAAIVLRKRWGLETSEHLKMDLIEILNSINRATQIGI